MLFVALRCTLDFIKLLSNKLHYYLRFLTVKNKLSKEEQDLHLFQPNLSAPNAGYR